VSCLTFNQPTVVADVREKFTVNNYLEMEQSEEMPFTSGVESVGMVDESAAAAGAPTRTTTNTIQGEATAAVNEVIKVYATEEQIRSVFLTTLVRQKLKLIF